jgi:hypothetical protein
MSAASSILFNNTPQKIYDVLNISRNPAEDSYIVKYAYEVPNTNLNPSFPYVCKFGNLTDVYDYLTCLSEFVNADIRKPDSIEIQFSGFPNIMIRGKDFKEEMGSSGLLCEALKKALRFQKMSW